MDSLPSQARTEAEVQPLSKYQRAIQRYGREYFSKKQREWRERNPRSWQAWNQKNPERRRELNREYQRRNNTERVEKSKEYYRNFVYPTRELDREAILGRPRPDKCEVCGRVGRISFDHCHATGKARGWLCSKCNTALGMVGDQPTLLRALAEYLEKSL